MSQELKTLSVEATVCMWLLLKEHIVLLKMFGFNKIDYLSF